MKRFAPVFALLLLFMAACSEDPNSYNSIDFQEPGGTTGATRHITIDETGSKFQPRSVYHGNPASDGKLYDTFSIVRPGIYVLNLMLTATYVYLQPGDATKIALSGNDMLPTYKFDGDGAAINRFFADNERIMTAALGPVTEGSLEHMGEADIAGIVTKIREEQKKLLQESGSVLSDSLRQFVGIENESRIATFCMFYRYKRNKLSPTQIATPVIDGLLQGFDGNKPAFLAISPSYRTAVYEYHKALFQAQDGGRNRLPDFHNYIKGKGISAPIAEYLLTMFAGNYSLTEYANPDAAKADYAYLISVLSDQECRTQVYQDYVKATRNAR